MTRIDFDATSDANNSIQYFECDLCIQDWKSKNDSMIIHVQQSSNCLVEVKRKVFETFKRISKEVVEQIVKTQTKTIETSKFEICVKNINFFDFILMLNLFEFHLFNISINFVQEIDAMIVKYQIKSVLIVLIKCLRDSTYIWFKTQLDFISLNNFKQALIVAFSFSTFFETFTTSLDTTMSHSSSSYNICFECFVLFSSISQFLTHTQKNCFKITCKHCEKIFNSNNKLHKHVRLKHARKSINSTTFVVNSFASKASLHAFQSTILTFKTSYALILHVSSISFFTFSYTSSLSHHKSHLKFYITIDDFYVMFAKKKQKSSFCNIQINVSFSFIRQIHIIDYFNVFCNIALNTFIKLKVFEYELASTLSINQKSRSSQTQNLKQSSNISNLISLQSITFFSTLRVN